MAEGCIESAENDSAAHILSRSVAGHQSLLRLSNGKSLETRRFIPAGQGDILRLAGNTTEIYVKQENCWLQIENAWTSTYDIQLGSQSVKVVFKEIETADELAHFDGLRKFHYRGGGGAGRTVPIIATSELWICRPSSDLSKSHRA